MASQVKFLEWIVPVVDVIVISRWFVDWYEIEEAERIMHCNGRVFCLDDEPGVHRVWLPAEEKPGLAMSRALGDFCVKNFGVISVPEVTQRSIISKDQFIILANDGAWDVISNQEAVQIVSSTPDKRKAAKRMVECAARACSATRQQEYLMLLAFVDTPQADRLYHRGASEYLKYLYTGL
ncbi:probable protein phosphatase 2C 34 [Papaver somniferum]|uniref:probable protein phosphatase 2C 34 n=1 Tax=Papaver somniferum TaxID=3469 RepID=UPI000E6FBC8D|nr:probable protein phosphatase 2C 34 [Papaver somniferum]